MRQIIFVDGSVGVGKSTFIKILADTFRSVLSIKNEKRAGQSAHNFNVEVLPEPLHRDWTQQIILKLGEYPSLLDFLLVRKVVAIETWSKSIASDGLQELEDNVLIVERSLAGDRRVSEGYYDFEEDLQINYTGESVHHIFIQNIQYENDEQMRLNMLYNQLELEGNGRAIHRIQRPRHISSYHAEAAAIVRKTLGY